MDAMRRESTRMVEGEMPSNTRDANWVNSEDSIERSIFTIDIPKADVRVGWQTPSSSMTFDRHGTTQTSGSTAHTYGLSPRRKCTHAPRVNTNKTAYTKTIDLVFGEANIEGHVTLVPRYKTTAPRAPGSACRAHPRTPDAGSWPGRP